MDVQVSSAPPLASGTHVRNQVRHLQKKVTDPFVEVIRDKKRGLLIA